MRRYGSPGPKTIPYKSTKLNSRKRSSLIHLHETHADMFGGGNAYEKLDDASVVEATGTAGNSALISLTASRTNF